MSDMDYLKEERIKMWSRIDSIEMAIKDITEYIHTNTTEEEKTIREKLQKSKELLTDISNTQETSLKALDESQETLKKINFILETSQNDAIEISRNHNNSEKLNSEIAKFYESSNELNERITTIAEELEEINNLKSEYTQNIKDISIAREMAADHLLKIDATLKNASKQKSEIDSTYYEIFGYTQENTETGEEEKIKGLKNELDETYKQLKSDFQSTEDSIDKFKKESIENIKNYQKETHTTIKVKIDQWEDDVTAIKSRINELLPNALTAGLSHAYSEKKTEEKKELSSHKTSFGLAIVLMMLVSLIPIGVSFYQIIKTNIGLDAAILQLPRLVFAIIPLYIPALWIAYASNKKINLSKRLIEEYSHKEALSKTYEGLATQIQHLENSEVTTELKTKLLYNILDVSSENPGKLISDYNKSDHPIIDALDRSVKLTDSLTKLARIPGFKKMAKNLADSAENALKIQSEKAEIALDTVNNKKGNSQKDEEL